MIKPTVKAKQRIDELKREFEELDVRERLETLLEFSDVLPNLPERYRARREAGEHRVPECQTPVYMWIEVVDDQVEIYADVPRDSPTVRGFISLLVEAFSGRSPADVLAVEPTLLRELGLVEALGMVRMRGLHAVLHGIKAGVKQAVKAAGEATNERTNHVQNSQNC
ncbi:MAG: SufE family protein [Planctomycetia bacterium]|nr:SufE family protein [Planctomycetia bacterium]